MRHLLLTVLLLGLAACGSRPTASEADAAVGSGVDGGADAGAASCGAKPGTPDLPECREGCSYLCGQQCPDICSAGGCWSCADGGWRQEAVDCSTHCP